MTNINARPKDDNFERMCLAEFASKYVILPKSQKPRSKSTVLVFQLQNDMGYVRQRKLGKEAVIRYPKFRQDKNPEDFYLSLIQLFIPHRSAVTLSDDLLSFEDYVRNGTLDGLNVWDIIDDNRRQFEVNTEELEKAWEDFEEGRVQEESWGSIAPEAEVERLEALMEKDVETVDEPENIPELSFDQGPKSASSGFHYELRKLLRRITRKL